MKRIRIGSDIFIRWTIQGADTFSLQREELRVEIRTEDGRGEFLTEFSWVDGMIAFMYPGSKQRCTGTYSLTLFREMEGRRTVFSTCKAFTLVSMSCEQSEGEYVVELSSRPLAEKTTGLSVLEEFLTAQTAFFTKQALQPSSLEAELIVQLLGISDYEGTPQAYASLYTLLNRTLEKLRTLATRNGATVEDADTIPTLIQKLHALPPNVYTLNKANNQYDNVNYKSVAQLPVIHVAGGNMSAIFANLQLVEEIHLQGMEDITTAREAFKGSGLLRKAHGLERLLQLQDAYQMLTNCSAYQEEVYIPSPYLSNADSIIFGCSLVPKLTIDQSSLTSAYNLCYNASSLKNVVLLGTPNAVDCNFAQAFYGCFLLEVIEGVMDVSAVTTARNLQNTFSFCTKLREVRIKGARLSIYLGQSPLLSRESALYLIENAQTITSNQTLTLSSALKEDGRLTDEDIAIATAKGWRVTFA